MTKKIVWTSRFSKDIKRMVKQNKKMNMIHLLITKLGKGESIPARFQPHRLKGVWKNYLECHIQPDWLLIWNEDKETVFLTRTGSHSDLLKK